MLIFLEILQVLQMNLEKIYNEILCQSYLFICDKLNATALETCLPSLPALNLVVN